MILACPVNARFFLSCTVCTRRLLAIALCMFLETLSSGLKNCSYPDLALPTWLTGAPDVPADFLERGGCDVCSVHGKYHKLSCVSSPKAIRLRSVTILIILIRFIAE